MDSYYRIAGVTFRFRSASEPPLTFLPGYSSFRLKQAPAQTDACYRFVKAPTSSLPPPESWEALWTSSQWSLHRCPDQSLLFHARANPAPDLHPAAWLSPDFRGGELYPRRKGPTGFRSFPFCFPIDEQVLLNRLALGGAALVHGCGIADQGRALLFCGRSGAGKSTLAKQGRHAGARILNDDRMLLRLDPGTPASASASPWHGELPDISPDPFPLAAICLLRQAPANRLTRLSPADGLSGLLANAIIPHYLPHTLGAATAVLARICETIPVYTLEFTPDFQPVDLLRLSHV